MVLVIVGLTAAYVLLRETSSPAQRVADANPPVAAVATAKVQDRVLESSITLQGTVTGGTVTDATIPTLASGTDAVVTRAAPESGATVTGGDLLYAVSDEPVFVLQGSLPLYRTITPGMTGSDVAALQAGLAAAGHRSSDASGYYGWSTGQAVRAMWQAAGFTPPRPDGIDDELDSARQAVDAAEPGPARSQAIEKLRSVQAKDGPVVLLGSITMVAQLPATVVDSQAAVGATVSGGAPLSLAYGAPVVKLDATAAQAGQVPVGASSVVHLTDGTSVKGTVIADLSVPDGGADTSGAEASASGDTLSGSGSAGPPVTSDSAPTQDGTSGSSGASSSSAGADQPEVLVRPSKALPADAVGKPVSAEIVLATTNTSVQAVPVSAVRVRDDGTNEVIVAEGGESHPVKITTGVTIGGWVQVAGSRPRLRTGASVIVGSGD